MTATRSLQIIAPKITSVGASWEGADGPHANWFVGYAPETDESTGSRVILGTLHVVGECGRGDIQVAATLQHDDAGSDRESFERDLIDSDALKTLYDFARVSLRSVLALVDTDAEVPGSSPQPEFEQLVHRSSADDEEGPSQ